MKTLPLKTYKNRCRCCLESFADNETPSPISAFFELQFFAFTKVELKPHELLSKHVCEYCHMELLRFSVWKKDLIEKQQSLYKKLNQQNGGVDHALVASDGEIPNESEDDEYKYDDDTTENEDNGENGEMSSEDEVDDQQILSEHEPDSDFEPTAHLRRNQTKPYEESVSKKKDDDLRCNKCNMTFIARQGMVRHVLFCKKEKKIKKKKKTVPELDAKAKYRCFCNERFTNKRALNIHRTRKHGRNANMSWDIINDEDDHESDNPIITKANSSVKTSPSKRLDQFVKCKHCPYTSNSKIALRRHVRTQHEGFNGAVQSSSKHQCNECYKPFSTSAALRMHVSTVHYNVRPHQCLYCKSSFKQLIHLKEHMLAIHKTLHKPYCCACGKSFTTLTALKQHKLQEHKDEDEDDIPIKSLKELMPPSKVSGKYICVCTREFQYPSRLLEHQRYCKSYRAQTEQVINEKSSKNKPHKCFKCGKSFNQKSNLIRHQKTAGHLDTILRENLSLKCERCKKKFASLKGLKKHRVNDLCEKSD